VNPGHGSSLGDELDPNLSRHDLALEGVKRDGVEILHSARRFVPGGKAEKAAERQVALCFLATALGSVAFTAIFVFWPFEYQAGTGIEDLYTPLLGLTMGIALSGLGVGAVLWAKKLMPEEEAVQERHEFASSDLDRATTSAVLLEGIESTGLGRRKFVTASLALGAASLGLIATIPIVGALIKKPGTALVNTSWRRGSLLVRADGTPVRLGDLQVGALETVFPSLPEGDEGHVDRPDRAQDSATMLIRMRPEELSIREGREDWVYDGHVAYSKICTHAGCPVSLYEQQTHHLLCPCHQSQFDAANGARPIFGPAARDLPQLAITVNEEGYFVALGDYVVPVGPSFWERDEYFD